MIKNNVGMNWPTLYINLHSEIVIRYSLLLWILLYGNSLFAQVENPNQVINEIDSNLIKKEKPYQYRFGHFFKTSTFYAVLLDTSNDRRNNVFYFNLKFYERAGAKWIKKKEFDHLQTSSRIRTRFIDYNNDHIKDLLIPAGIVGTGGNETEYLFIIDQKTKSILYIKGFENIPSTSYNPVTGVITSIGLAAGIPSFEYYKIRNFELVMIGGKQMWADDDYGYMEKYRMVNGKIKVYYRSKKKLPIDFYTW